MVKTIANLTQKKMEVFLRYSTVRIKPMFRITPEPFDPVNMVSTFRSSPVFTNDDVVTPNGQGRISLPVVRVVQTARTGVLLNQPDQFSLTSSLDRKCPDQSVALKQAENDHLAGRAPASFALAMPAKHGLVAFDRPLKRIPAILLKGTAGTNQTVKTLNGRSRCQTPEAHPVDRNTKGEQFHQSGFGSVGKTTAFPDRFDSKPGRTATTFQTTVGQFPSTSKLTFWTAYHT